MSQGPSVTGFSATAQVVEAGAGRVLPAGRSGGRAGPSCVPPHVPQINFIEFVVAPLFLQVLPLNILVLLLLFLHGLPSSTLVLQGMQDIARCV